MDGNQEFSFNVDDVIGALIHAGQNLSAHLSSRQIHSDWNALETHIERMQQMFAIARAHSEARIAAAQAAAAQASAQPN